MNASGTEKLLLKVSEAAEALGISRSHCYELIQSGRLPTIRLGGSVRVPACWLRQFVDQEVLRWQRARGEL